MSSPPVVPIWVCANGLFRLRPVRARTVPAGFLVLVASIVVLGLNLPAAAQFPIRQFPQRIQNAEVGGQRSEVGSHSVWPATGSRSPTTGNYPNAVNASSPAGRGATLPAVARIVVPEKDGISYGSGTLIDARGQFGLVVSNWHVVRDAAGQITVEFPDGFKSPAQVVKTDKDWDLAALSIYRPTVQPIPIAANAPQPGDPLTIAGYGSGDWRMASGRCTQYLAPGIEFPHEMVELSAEARQGDSGGPILNQRGEVAGVLFGSGPGYTSGSYGGRVLKFLATVVPGGAPGSDGLMSDMAGLANSALPPSSADPLLAALTPPPITQPPQTTALRENTDPPVPTVPYTPAPPRHDPPEATVLTPALRPTSDPLLSPPPRSELAERFGTSGSQTEVDSRVAVSPSRIDLSPTPLPTTPNILPTDNSPAVIHTALLPRATTPSTPPVDLHHAPPDQLLAAVWRKFGGTTLFDQAKSVLAIIGGLALLVVFVRFGSQKEREHHEEE